MKRILLLIVLVSGCNQKVNDKVTDGALSPALFSEKISGDVVIIDVRTPEEYSTGFIPGAVNIDFRATDFGQKIESLDKSQTYLVYCASGVRSAKAAELMKAKGFEFVNTLEGGTNAWVEEEFPLE